MKERQRVQRKRRHLGGGELVMKGGVKTKAGLMREAMASSQWIAKLQTSQAECQRAKEESRKFKTICDRAGYGVSIASLEGEFTYVNESYAQMHGYSAEELVGQHYSILYTEESLERLNRLRLKLLEDTTYFAEELWRRRKDGTVFPSLTTAGVIKSDEGEPLYISATAIDITKHKRAEEALRRNWDYLEKLNNSLPEVILTIRLPERIIEYVNRSVETIFGYKPEECIGQTTEILYPSRKDYLEANERRERAIRQERSGLETERLLKRKNGELFPSHVITTFLREGTKITHTISVIRDVTERKRMEEALRKSEQDYEILVNSIEGIMWEADAQTFRFSFVSKQAERLLGYPPELWLAEPTFWKDHIHPDDRDWAVDFCRQATKEKRPHEFEYRMVTADGRTVWLRDIVTVIVENDQPVKLRGLMVDITKRKRMEEALRESEERYRALLELGTRVGEAVAMLQDTEKGTGIYTFVSDEWVRITGYSREELLGMSMADVIHPKYRGAAIERYKRRLQGETIPGLFELSIIRKDGTEVPIEVTSAFTTYRGKRANVVYIRDITERKKRQEQLLITDRLASIGELASGIAHELNNPLTGILGFSQLLLDKDVPEDVKEDLRVISRESQRAASIVKNFLSFARKHPAERKPVQINEVIEGVVKLRAYEQNVHNIEVATQLAPDLPLVLADSFQLQQVFLNIIINAEHFMTKAHGKGTITITTEQAEDVVRISLADDGPGISQENLGHLFDPFFTTKEEGKGTGLGLSICHGIIAEHGGRIYAESELGKGATFVIELPVLSP
ncbi:MAG TPA: PAS domain S-box protein [Dehalococcoidia bacterium]|nr:PAS domain S-box protein [Dehalococcoidia bacterium]